MPKPSKILVLTWGLPPAINGASIVMRNFLKRFSRRTMVAVGAFGSGPPPAYWDPAWPRLVRGMYQPPTTWRLEKWIRRLEFPAVFLVSLATLLRYRCQVILANYPDQFFLLAGYLLSRLFNKPLFVFLQNTYSDGKAGSRFAPWLQERLFRHARHVFVMSPGMREFFREKYPRLATTVLPHILDTAPRLPRQFKVPDFHRPMRLVFAGNINYSCEEAAGRFLELVRSRPDLTLRIFTGMDPALLERMGYGGDRIEVMKVPYRELPERIGESDIVIHPHGFTGTMTDAEYRTIFPTKTLEFLASRRPILAHAPDDSYIARFYRENHCALVVSEPSVEALSAAVDRLKAERVLRARLVRNAVRSCRLFSGEDIVRTFESTIEKKLDGGRS